MFPASNNDEPFHYTSKTIVESSFTNDHHQNPSSNSRQEDHPFFINFPSPFLEDHELPLSQILSQQHKEVVLEVSHHGKEANPCHGETSMEEMSVEANRTPSKKRNLGTTPRRRTGKKDRHSKICTAQGVRDRRVRLSLHIARKFFDLQDMLGYDKASKTIEWLFSKSNNAIKELSENMAQKDYSDEGNKVINSENFCSATDDEEYSLMSECEEVGSRWEENSNNSDVKEKGKLTEMVHYKRESRNKARERARERTKEKMMVKGQSKTNPNSSTNIFDQLGWSSSNSGFLDQESNNSYNTINQEKGSPHEANSQSLEQHHHHHHQFASTGIDSSGNCFMSFLGNWEMINYAPMTNMVQIPFAGNPSSIYLANSSYQFQPLDQEKHLSFRHHRLD